MKKKYKTTFPVTRIKKIVQKDKDIGKVAQATPVVISKALELFLQSLIDTACEETRVRNGKRLSVAHLKATILATDQFDFLKDIVEGVSDPAGPAADSLTLAPSTSTGSSGSGQKEPTVGKGAAGREGEREA